MTIQTFDDLRREIGRIVGQSMGKGQMRQVIKERDRMGAFALAEQEKSIIAILEFLEYNFDKETKND